MKMDEESSDSPLRFDRRHFEIKQTRPELNSEVSHKSLPNGLFITGTDTNVGKTHITCLIVRQLLNRGIRAAAYKPVCSGAIVDSTFTQNSDSNSSGGLEAPASAHWAQTSADKINDDQSFQARWEDIDRLFDATNGLWSAEFICPQRFHAATAPPTAAALEGRSVDEALLISGAYRFADADVLLVEGVGGWLSPVSERFTVADLAAQFDLPVLIVARAGLGTINHTLLTIESIRARGLYIAGVVMNEVVPCAGDLSCPSNGDEIAVRGDVDVLGTVPHGNNFELHRNRSPVTIDWQKLMQSKQNRENA